MVISPKEASKITDEELDLVDRLESEIDEMISSNSKNNITNHTYAVPLDMGMGSGNLRVLDEIERRYSAHYQVKIDCRKLPVYISLAPLEIPEN